MSVEAISWAFNLAPVPRDHNGKRNPACKAVLIGLANHAGPDGKDAFPSVRTLVRYTDLSERTVRTALDRLEAEGTIQPCDPAVVAAKIKRADHRPQGWDLSMQLIRDDLEEEDLAALENQFPGLTARVRAVRKAGSDRPGCGVQPLHPAPETAVDNDADEVQPLHPAARTGCNRRSDGVQPFPERGAAVAPEPSIEPSKEPSAAPARTRGGPGPVENSREAAVGVDKFFAALGPQWPLTAGQRDRLAPAVAAARAVGWPPRSLASFVGANVCWRSERVCGAGITFVPRRTARAADRRDVTVAAPVVRGLRPGHPDAGLGRRRTTAMPCLQASIRRDRNSLASHPGHGILRRLGLEPSPACACGAAPGLRRFRRPRLAGAGAVTATAFLQFTGDRQRHPRRYPCDVSRVARQVPPRCSSCL